MKILFTADLHFHNYKPFSHLTSDGENSRLLDICDTVNEIFNIADRENCNTIIVAGDIFHTRGVLKPSVIARAKQVFLNRYEQIILLAGNHDLENYKGGYTALEVFKGVDNIKVIDKCHEVINLDQDLKMLAIPYIHGIKSFEKTYTELSSEIKECKLVTIHQGIDDIESNIPSGLTTEFLTKNNDSFIFAGHYHKPKREGNCIQIGSPLQHNFSDIGQDKGCWVFNSENNNINFHKIDVAPKFVETDKITKENKEQLKGNFVRINAKSSKDAFKMLNQLEEINVQSVVKLEKEFTTAHEQTILPDRPEKMLAEYIDIQEDMKPLKNEILELFKELSI